MTAGINKTEVRSPADRVLGWTASVVFTPGRGVKPRHFKLGDPVIRIDRTSGAVGSSLVLDDPSVSQGTVTLRECEDGRYELEDNGSRNPVRVNGVSVRRARLNANDVVRVGDSLIVIDVDDPARSSRRKSTLASRRVDELMKRLFMYDSTASSLLRLDASLIEPDYECIALWTPGPLESRVVAEWLSESWGVDLDVVEAAHEHAPQRTLDAPSDQAVMINRIDFASPSAMLELKSAIERRTNSGSRSLTIVTIEGALRNDRPPIVDQVVALVAQFELYTPRLQDRKVDILRAIAAQLADQLSEEAPELSVDLCEHFLCYPWPGELAELKRNVSWLKSIVKRGEPLKAGVLPSSMRSVKVDPDRPTGQNVTADAVLAAFHEHDGNMTAVAAHFGYSRTYFYKLMKASDIDIQALRQKWSESRD